MKSVLISIQPKWVEKIAKGEKTIEVRKSRPKLETPFKCYIYQTKKFVPVDITDGVNKHRPFLRQNQGKVIGEFTCNKIDSYIANEDNKDYWDLTVEEWEDLKKKSCLSIPQILDYSENSSNLYGWHISDLKIYDKPKELSEFRKPFKYDGDGVICGTEKEMNDIYEWDCETFFKNRYPNFDFENCKCEDCPKAKDFYRLTRPPQSWQKVESLGE